MAIVARADVAVSAVGVPLAEAQLTSLGAQMKAFGASAAAVSGGAIIAVAAIAAIGVAAGIAVHQAADFQTQLTQLVTGAGEIKSNLDLVRKGILQMATDTGTSTDQLTAGLYMIESGGYHGAAGLEILKNAAKGAKVGAADLGVVADATDTILKNFGDTGLTSTQAVNTLIVTVANGKTHMQDLAQSLSQVLPTASAAGVGLNDVMGAMATMTAEGVPAAEAATYLRQTLIALSAPGDQAKKMLEDLGLSSTKVANDMHTSLPMAIQEITDAIAKKFPIGSAQYVAAVRDIMGGMRQMQGFLDIGGKNIGRFTELTAKIATTVKAGGESITGWNDVQGTFNQQIGKAGAAVQVLFITLGTYLLPVLTKVAAAVGDAIARFTPFITSIISNREEMQKLAPYVAVLAGAIGGMLVAAFVSLAMAMLPALGEFLLFAAPFIAIGAAIVLLIIGIKALMDHWKQISAFIEQHFGPQLLVLKTQWDAITTAVGWLVGKIGDLLGLLGRVKDAIGGLHNIILPGGIHIPGFAEGGVTPGGPVIVGERGPELLIPPAGSRVMPLPGGTSGARAGAASTQQSTFIIQLDGRVIAQSTLKHAPGVIRLATGTRSF